MTGFVFIILLLVFYVLHTLSYAIYFSKTSKKLFDKKQRGFHLLIMWIVPFYWIAHLKATINQLNSYGSSKREVKTDYSNFVDNRTFWVHDFYSFFHGNTNSHSTSNNAFHSDIHPGHGHDSHDFGGHHHSDSGDAVGGHH